MAITPVSTSTATQSAFGLDFQSLLRIVLNELTYQDPLNPVSNSEFVSQLGQFSQLQLSQTLNNSITQLLQTQAAQQATSLLGQTVDFSNAGSTVSGQVTAIAFSNGTPSVTIQTTGGQTIGSLPISSIVQIRPTP